MRGDTGGLGQEQGGRFTTSWHFFFVHVFACLTWTNMKRVRLLHVSLSLSLWLTVSGFVVPCSSLIFISLKFDLVRVLIIVRTVVYDLFHFSLFLFSQSPTLKASYGRKRGTKQPPCKSGGVCSYINQTHPSWQSLGEAWQTCTQTQAVQIWAQWDRAYVDSRRTTCPIKRPWKWIGEGR